ncbi:hypothetical protein GUITHDRAFT_113289 [Guillardia theta CCMP2712]|uniref:Uncharacterized protein n=1 Tax=Guillardia theta (strain CCMP2712) TaxID=905079 RepID=L1IXC1_GUITC|nr:hypothetical protein GUITHDRAFT_113289 [Guillardia theta CCMP2712]EKX40500.1 hypothetical protein GUITHDRAFT_113289 [Guillardia theta CCMP2712]|eukprot:XP_005827480.1 hypothetical protein GUITHDRAFT_113289 [Guillardia theta CCMP2712]
MRPKKENMGRVGILAEVAQLLRLNDSSTGDICEIYRQLCLKQGLAIIDLIPNAGMTVNLPPKRNLPPKKVFAAVGIETVNQNREVDWIATCSSLEAADIVLQAFDRHGKDRAGVTLGLVSENDKILKWFSVQMEATALHRSFKLRAKRGPWGKGGSLAELSQLLAPLLCRQGSSPEMRLKKSAQSLAAAEVQPLAGMLVQGAGQRGRKGPSPKTYVAVGASTGTLQQKELEWVLSSPSTASCEQTLASFRESEAMEGVHLTLISDDAKLRETFAVELTADTFVPRGKIAKQRRALRERDHAGRSSFRVQIKSRSSMSTGRFSRKEMEALCGGGNTSITRVKRAMLELARRIGVTPVSVEVEEDRDTLSWDGSSIALSLATKADARRLMDDMPFYLEGILEVKLEAVGFKLNGPQHEEERSPSSEEQAQEPQGQQQGAGWLELSDIDRITMEAASPSGPVDQQVLVDLSTMLLETSEEELLAGKPISLELDKSVGKLHDTFCSPGNVEFMTLGAWAATPTLGSKRNMLKEKLRAYLGEQRWTRVQGNKAARRGSAFSPRAAATDALEQEAESDDIESRSVSLLFLIC